MTIINNLFTGALVVLGCVCLVDLILSIVRHRMEIKELKESARELEGIKEREYWKNYIHNSFKDIK